MCEKRNRSMRGVSAGEEQEGQQWRAGGAVEEAAQTEHGRRGPPSYASGGASARNGRVLQSLGAVCSIFLSQVQLVAVLFLVHDYGR